MTEQWDLTDEDTEKMDSTGKCHTCGKDVDKEVYIAEYRHHYLFEDGKWAYAGSDVYDEKHQTYFANSNLLDPEPAGIGESVEYHCDGCGTWPIDCGCDNKDKK